MGTGYLASWLDHLGQPHLIVNFCAVMYLDSENKFFVSVQRGPTPPKSGTAVASLGPEEARKKRKAQQRLQKRQWQRKYIKRYSEGDIRTRGGGGGGGRGHGFHVGEWKMEEDGLTSDGEMRPCLNIILAILVVTWLFIETPEFWESAVQSGRA